MSRSEAAYSLNLLALVGVCGVLILAFGFQLIGGELPCPLCLLQRGCYIAVGIGFLCNVRFGSAPSHYSLILVSAVLGAITAGRQVLLHIVPGSGSYGSPLWGLHLYTWAFIGFGAVVVYVALILPLLRNAMASEPPATDDRAPALAWAGRAVMVVFAVLIAANLASTLLECGFGQCAENPANYLWLSG